MFRRDRNATAAPTPITSATTMAATTTIAVLLPVCSGVVVGLVTGVPAVVEVAPVAWVVEDEVVDTAVVVSSCVVAFAVGSADDTAIVQFPGLGSSMVAA